MKGYLLLRIKQIIRETPEAATFVLEQVNGKPVQFKAGQFLTLIFEKNGKEIRRSYSLSSAPGIDSDLCITVKQMENGEFSRYMLGKLKTGDPLKALSPAGRFTFPDAPAGQASASGGAAGASGGPVGALAGPASASGGPAITPGGPPITPADVFLLAAGSGIVPVFSILKMLLRTRPELKITLFYSNFNEMSTIFREEINRLAEKYSSQFRCIHILSRPGKFKGTVQAAVQARVQPSDPAEQLSDPAGQSPVQARVQPPDRAGRPPVQVIQGHLNNLLLERLIEKYLHFNKHDALFFICGPFTYMRMAQITLRVAGFTEAQLHKENFIVNEPVPPRFTYPDGPYPKILLLSAGGKTHRLKADKGQTVLEAARQAGLDLPYSCKAGACATCTARCVEGEVKMAVNEVLTAADLEQGLVLTCVAYPVTENVHIQIEI